MELKCPSSSGTPFLPGKKVPSLLSPKTWPSNGQGVGRGWRLYFWTKLSGGQAKIGFSVLRKPRKRLPVPFEGCFSEDPK